MGVVSIPQMGRSGCPRFSVYIKYRQLAVLSIKLMMRWSSLQINNSPNAE